MCYNPTRDDYDPDKYTYDEENDIISSGEDCPEYYTGDGEVIYSSDY